MNLHKKEIIFNEFKNFIQIYKIIKINFKHFLEKKFQNTQITHIIQNIKIRNNLLNNKKNHNKLLNFQIIF